MTTTPGQRTAFLTVAEVADMLRVSRMTVYRWVHAGDLPAKRFGRSFRVPQQAVEAFMENAALHGGMLEAEDGVGESAGPASAVG